jgi:hypothetical protein
MNQELYFFSPGENQYYSMLSLWGVARVSKMANGTPWLEPQWVGGHGEVPDGLALYTCLHQNFAGSHDAAVSFRSCCFS